jgi:hypothetical protein
MQAGARSSNGSNVNQKGRRQATPESPEILNFVADMFQDGKRRNQRG